MKAIVVYESLWGNTAAVAKAIAEGIGDAQALSTGQATSEIVAQAEVIVAGGPVFALRLSTDEAREQIRSAPEQGVAAPDFSHPSLRSWMDALPAGVGGYAAFDTRVRGPWGKGTSAVARGLESKGYSAVAKPQGFVVQGKQGPLKPGELERAREWGQQIAEQMT